MGSLFTGLITSRTRVEILMRLFLDPARRAHLRELSADLGVSPSQVKTELANLESSGLLVRSKAGNRVRFAANAEHALFPELHSMVKKSLGMDRILDSIVARLGDLEQALLLDDYAEGKDSGIIDLLLVGDIDERNLLDLVRKTEKYIGRKIRTLCLSRDEHASLRPKLAPRPQLVLWRRARNAEPDRSALSIGARCPVQAPPPSDDAAHSALEASVMRRVDG